jgi:hypothetical protein
MSDLGERLTEVHNITHALIKTVEGIDATPDVLARGVGNFASWVLVRDAVKQGHDPRDAVQRWCLHLMDSAAERHKLMVGLGLSEPTDEPTRAFF